MSSRDIHPDCIDYPDPVCDECPMVCHFAGLPVRKTPAYYAKQSGLRQWMLKALLLQVRAERAEQ